MSIVNELQEGLYKLEESLRDTIRKAKELKKFQKTIECLVVN